MRKTLLFILFCVTWMCAQTNARTTITGCLTRSGDHYTLTDKSGTTYQLAGHTVNLDGHVGNTIAVRGSKNSPAPDSNSNPGTTANTGNPGSFNTFEVRSVEHLASGCGASQ
jgi:hypothetical protein